MTQSPTIPKPSDIPSFEVGQKVVVFSDKSEILFLRRSSKVGRAGGWDFPGGGLEHEDPVEGLRREAREEAAIEIDEIKPLILVSHPQDDLEPWLIIVGYMAHLKSGTVTLSWEHDEFRWLGLEEAQTVELPDGHKKFLQAAINSMVKSTD